jgi:hypothetical protein
MFRLIVVLSLLAAPLGAKQIPAASDTIPCDGTVKMSRTFCPSCEAWSDQFSPDFTGQIPVEFHLSIFNKDSVEIFSSTDIDKGWSGTGKDNYEQTQTFTWQMEYRYEKNGQLYRCEGKVILIQ